MPIHLWQKNRQLLSQPADQAIYFRGLIAVLRLYSNRRLSQEDRYQERGGWRKLLEGLL